MNKKKLNIENIKFKFWNFEIASLFKNLKILDNKFLKDLVFY